MRKNLILILLLFLSSYIFPQISLRSTSETRNQVKIEIFNNNANQSAENRNNFMDSLPDVSSPGSPRLLSKTYYVAIPPNSKITAELVKKNFLINTNYSPTVNPKVSLVKDSVFKYEEVLLDKKYFVTDQFPANDIEILGYTWLRNYYLAIVKINFQKFNWKKNELIELKDGELLVSFKDIKPFVVNRSEDQLENSLSSLIINFEQAKEFKSFPDLLSGNNTANDWIDFSKEYVKLKIPRDGIYRITYSDLIDYGVNAQSINPKTIKIYNKGNQLSIYVSGENDLSFNENDFIEFWAEKNYSNADYTKIVAQGEDYINYFDRYTDTTFVWLTWDGVNGKREVIEDNVISHEFTPLNIRKEKIHLEQDLIYWYYDAVNATTQLPFWQHHKVFTWKTANHDGNTAFTFNSNSFLPNSLVKTNFRLISNAANIQANAHKFGVSLNESSLQDTIAFNYKQTVNFTSEIPASLLKNGTNTLKVHGIPTQASFHRALVDWIDIEFNCNNDAINDSLLVIIPDNTARALRTVTINNVTSSKENYIVRKIKPYSKQFYNFQVANGKLIFSDTLESNDTYIILKKDKTIHPVFVKKKYFTSLLNADGGADYIIITNKLLSSSANHYNDFIGEKYNIRTKLIFVDDIYDEFSYGYLKAEAIKSFLISAYNSWNVPKPSYLLLIGDANYDYKDTWDVPVRKKNLVPSYGNPVSDYWYVMFDSTRTSLPQMCVGRIPANSNQEVENYLNKHNEYLLKQSDEWNKHFLFFSGGDITKTTELAEIKAVNDTIFNRYVKSFPLSGSGKHFYKTANPLTNFGPYSQKEIDDAIDSSGIFISYIGHSGTQTWDNGITKVEDLKNSFSNRFPVMSDFGCSTGKFAEPDVDAFGELFVSGSSDGQAINYMGNASLGYLQTSKSFPIFFSDILITENVASVGLAHLNAKLKLFNEGGGFSEVNRVFCYCNLLFGDPIIPVAIPKKSNFVIKQNNIAITGSDPNDQIDSVTIKLIIKNNGLGIHDSLSLSYFDTYKDSEVFRKTLKIPSVLNSSQIDIKVPVKGKAGEHKLSVVLDPDGLLDELDETDNSTDFIFNVYNISIRYLGADKYYSIDHGELFLLNPMQQNNSVTEDLIVEYADNQNFILSSQIKKKIDTLITRIPFNAGLNDQRYWWRAKVNSPSANWSETFSLNKENKKYTWYIDDKHLEKDINYNNTVFDSNSNSWKLNTVNNNLKIASAGESAGTYASIQVNSQEKLSNTYFWGIASAELDTVTLQVKNVKFFVNPTPQSADSLIKYINRLPIGTTVIMTICNDGAQSVLGFSNHTPARDALKALGSYYADSIAYKESWCMVGKKGAAIGSVPEVYKKPYQGSAIIELNKLVRQNSGEILFPVVSKSYDWKNIVFEKNLPEGSNLEILPVIINQSKIDTLAPLLFTSDTVSIAHLNENKYSDLRLLAKFKANSSLESPEIKSIGINYTSLPELSINYQVVSVSDDTLKQGDNSNLKFHVYNVGGTKAEDFNVKVELIKPDNSTKLVLDSLVTGIDSMQHKEFNIKYLTNHYDGIGEMKFKIFIDPENKVPELFEDNNIFEMPFYVTPDTPTVIASGSVAVTFDGVDIINGDYVSTNPDVAINLKYPIWFPVYDSTSIEFYMDNEKINYSQLNIFSDTINRKAVYKYKPSLLNGQHSFKVLGKDITGEIGNTAGYEVVFNVSNELKLMNVYNYPNPLKDNTNFTFILTQAPDELKIKIFTVAGRLIREINSDFYPTHAGFNSIPWDGKDQDGNTIANGVYIYKLIVKKDGKTESQVSKLAIVK